jgi:hypothetical protein
VRTITRAERHKDFRLPQVGKSHERAGRGRAGLEIRAVSIGASSAATIQGLTSLLFTRNALENKKRDSGSSYCVMALVSFRLIPDRQTSGVVTPPAQWPKADSQTAEIESTRTQHDLNSSELTFRTQIVLPVAPPMQRAVDH